MKKRIFLRGGISNKYCYIKDGFAVGEGLVEAYLTESVIAKNPRIALHPSIERNKGLIEKIEFLSRCMYGGRLLVKKDPDDGVLFLDYIGFEVSSTSSDSFTVALGLRADPSMLIAHKRQTERYICGHYEALTNKLSELQVLLDDCEKESEDFTNLSRVLEKFTWLKNYHNRSISNKKEFLQYVVK